MGTAAADDAPPAPAAGDTFSRVALALRRVLGDVPTLRHEHPDRFRNLILDACGSDLRPLVELVLSVGREHDAALAAPLRPADGWEGRRAALLHHVVATRYLQPDVARWILDAWGAALGRLDPRLVHPPTVLLDEPTRAVDGGRTAGRLDGQGGMRPGARTIGGPAAAPAASRGGRGPVAPTGPTAPAAGGAAAHAGTPAIPGAPSWAGGTHASRLGARPIAWRRGSPVAPPSPRSPIPSGSTARVERVAAVLFTAAVVMSLVATTVIHRGRMAIKRADEQARRNAVLRPVTPPVVVADPPDSASPPQPDDVDAPPATGGWGGTYRVWQRVRGVIGADGCAPVAAALATSQLSMEAITHRAGDTLFAMPARRITGVVNDAGGFTVAPMQGSTDGIQWVFRMRGVFTPDGFRAESETTTDAILRWRRSQRCTVLADLEGVRVASRPAAPPR